MTQDNIAAGINDTQAAVIAVTTPNQGGNDTQAAAIETTTPNISGHAAGTDDSQKAGVETTTQNQGGDTTQAATLVTTTENVAGQAAGTDSNQTANITTTTPNDSGTAPDNTQKAEVVVTEENGAAGASDSTPTAFDVVTFFDTTKDSLKLPSDTSLSTLAQTTVDGLTMSVSSGVVTFTGDGTATAKIAALLTGMGATEAVAGFVDSGNAYIVYNDGVAGSSDADIVVELAGVDTLTALPTIEAIS